MVGGSGQDGGDPSEAGNRGYGDFQTVREDMVMGGVGGVVKMPGREFRDGYAVGNYSCVIIFRV